MISGSVCSQWFTFCTYPLKTDTKYINVSHFYWVFSNLQAKQQIFYIIYLQKVELSHQMSVVLFEKALKRGFIEKFKSFLFIRCFLSGKFLKKMFVFFVLLLGPGRSTANCLKYDRTIMCLSSAEVEPEQ